jgi:mannose/fructose/N-acetylgalactosamine-specific phosphotransferase system component IIC
LDTLSYALLLSLVGALILLDKWAFGEFGLSQPIVSCPLIGLIFGDFTAGLWLGTALQLVWVDALPLGAGRPLDYQAGGVAGAVAYFLLRHGCTDALTPSWPDLQNRALFCALFLAALGTVFGQFTDDRLKRLNAVFYHLGMKARTAPGVAAAHLLALLASFARGLVVTALFLAAAWAIRPWLARLPTFRPSELLLLPLAIGAAGLIRLFYRRERIPVSFAGAVVSAALWFLLK